MGAVALIAFCYGGGAGVYPLLTADHFGIKNVGSNYGAVMVGFALSALCFPILVNQIGGNAARFLLLAALSVTGALLMAPLGALKPVKRVQPTD